MTIMMGPAPPSLRDAPAVAELFVGVFRRDLLNFYPQSRFEPVIPGPRPDDFHSGPDFQLIEEPESGDDPLQASIFGVRYRLAPRGGGRFSRARPADDPRPSARCCNLRYHHLFQIAQHRRGWSSTGAARTTTTSPPSSSRVLRAAVGAAEPDRLDDPDLADRGAVDLREPAGLDRRAPARPRRRPRPPPRPTPADALPYGVELTSLKSMHRLCDGQRTLFLVDREGRLAEIIDVEQWVGGELAGTGARTSPAPGRTSRTPAPPRSAATSAWCSARTRRSSCSPRGCRRSPSRTAAGGSSTRRRSSRSGEAAVAKPRLARVLFQAALDLAEGRQGGLFVVVADPCDAVGRLIAPHDLLATRCPAARRPS